MSKTEILAELAHLSPDDLAEVRAWLERLMVDRPLSKADVDHPRIRSPRLVRPSQSADFIKHVTELTADAAL
jgi:hypothetical protein